MNYRSDDHHLVETIAWRPEHPAERVSDCILLSRGTSSGFLVTTPGGDVVINTGTTFQGARYRERYEQLLGRPLDVKAIVITQSHPDHMGGWSAFATPGAPTYVQRRFLKTWRERDGLAPYFAPRTLRVLPGLLPKPEERKAWFNGGTRAPEADDLTPFGDSTSFEVGGVRFELYSAPSGETLDSVIVWLPQQRALFTGNFMGALYGALPHFYTLRGDRDRSVARFLDDIQFAIDLKPRLLATGHDFPVEGEERIAGDLGRIRDAVRFIHDETIKGMNAHKSLWTLMDEIALPPTLKPAPGRGPVRWYVRAVWEEYVGWFRQESTTELYGTPPSAVAGDLVELAGAEALVARARKYNEAGQPLKALHLIDIVLAVSADHGAAREAQIVALTRLIDDGRGEHYDEIGWLETELAAARAAIARNPP